MQESKYQNIPINVYVPNWLEEMFVVIKTENTLPCPYVISHLNGEEIYVTWNVL